MSVDFNAVLFFGVRCNRSQLYETYEAPGCKHKVDPKKMLYCPTCGARAVIEHERPLEGYDEDSEKLMVGGCKFQVFKPDYDSDRYFVGMKLARTDSRNGEYMIGVDISHGLDHLPPAAVEQLIKIGVADEVADCKLWVILQVS